MKKLESSIHTSKIANGAGEETMNKEYLLPKPDRPWGIDVAGEQTINKVYTLPRNDPSWGINDVSVLSHEFIQDIYAFCFTLTANWRPGLCNPNLDMGPILIKIGGHSDFYYNLMIKSCSLLLCRISPSNTVFLHDFSFHSSIYLNNTLPVYFASANYIFASISSMVTLFLGWYIVDGSKKGKFKFNFKFKPEVFIGSMLKWFILFGLINLSNAAELDCAPVRISTPLLLHLLWWIGILVYLCLGTLFDFYSIRIQVRKIISTNLKTSVLLGVIYTIQIGVGILATDSLYYLIENTKNNLAFFLIFTPLTVISASAWHLLRNPHPNPSHDLFNSFLRSLAETFFFCFICISTFVSWPYILEHIMRKETFLIAHIICMLIGLVGYILFGVYIIKWDSTYLRKKKISKILYGFIYTLWFTSALFESNGVVELIQEKWAICDYPAIWAFLICVSFLATIFTYPKFYPFNIRDPNAPNSNADVVQVWNQWSLKEKIFYLLHLQICINSYCLCYGLIWSVLAQLVY